MKYGVLATTAVVLAACGVAIQQTRLPGAPVLPPVPMEEVDVFFANDELPEHDRIAILDARDEWDHGRQAIIDALRKKAGELGANAIVLDNITGTTETGNVMGYPYSIQSDGAIAIYIEP